MADTVFVFSEGGSGKDISATLETSDPNMAGGEYAIRACIPIDPSSLIPPIVIEGRQAQVEIGPRSPTGDYRILEVIGPVASGTTTATLSGGTGSAAGVSPQTYDLSGVALRIHPDPANHVAMDAPIIGTLRKTWRSGPYIETKEYYSRFSGGGDTALTLNTWVTFRFDSPGMFWIDMLITNGNVDPNGDGTGSRFTNENPSVDGEYWYSELEIVGLSGVTGGPWSITSDVVRHSMDLANGKLIAPVAGKSQVFPPRCQWARRFGFYTSGNGTRCNNVLRKRGLAIARGTNSYFEKSAFGVQGWKMPTLTSAYARNSLTGEAAAKDRWLTKLNDLRNDLQNNTSASYWLQENVATGAWFQPPHNKDGSNANGLMTQPALAWFPIIEQITFADLLLQCTTDRMPVAYWNPATGYCLDPDGWASITGSQPFDQHDSPNRMDLTSDWFMHPGTQPGGGQHAAHFKLPTSRDWNSHSDPAVDGSIRWHLNGSWQYFDREHASRYAHVAVPTIWWENDPMARYLASMVANYYHCGRTHRDIAVWKFGPNGSASIKIKRDEILAAQGLANVGDRAFTWMAYLNCLRYSIETNTWREANRPDWFLKWAEIIGKGTSTPGHVYRANQGGGTPSPNPYTSFGAPNIPGRYGSYPDNVGTEGAYYDCAQVYMLTFHVLTGAAGINQVFAGVNGQAVTWLNRTARTLGTNIANSVPTGDQGRYPQFCVPVGDQGGAAFSVYGGDWILDDAGVWQDSHTMGDSGHTGYAEASTLATYLLSGRPVSLIDKIKTFLGQYGETDEDFIDHLMGIWSSNDGDVGEGGTPDFPLVAYTWGLVGELQNPG